MVSNKEISKKLIEEKKSPGGLDDIYGDMTISSEDLKKKFTKRKGIKKKGYLVCESCMGYYKLQKDESPEHFDNCQCGGILRYFDNLEDIFII